MGAIPFAFSVHNFISSVGADAGFAAIIGLAVLVLLYFAHARETANLREEAAILAARLQQAELRVAELTRPQPVSAVVPAAAGVQVKDQRGAAVLAAAAPFAPAGMGAPALAAATRVVPLPVAPAPAPAPPATPAPVAEPAAPEPAPPAEAQPAVAMAAAPAAASASSAAASSPAPVPAAAAPPASPPPAMPAPATTAGANGGGRGSPTPPPASATPAPGPASTGAPLVRPLPPIGPPASTRSPMARRVAIGLVALAVIAAAVVALVVITGNNGTSPKSAGQPRTTNAPAPGQSAGTFAPAAVTVAVLNGTATNQLAHRVAAKLSAGGYKEGRVATAANQTQAATVVAYLPGAKNRTAALHVAHALNLRPGAVRPIDPGTQQVACPPPGSCPANVVVTVGADLATL